MDNDLINSQATGPIVRSTNAQRLANFEANANSIYNKFTPFTTYSFGPSQPFVYTKISDSTPFKNLTKYDTQVAPIGSTIRDAKRIGQYLATGNGLLFIGKQLLLQQQNAFNETRIYNPLSVLKATLKPGSLGAIDYPKRHLETSGGLLNFFKDALLSTVGYETKDAEKPRIDGTATGDNGVAYSVYAGKHGGAKAGLLRFNTANKASSNFNEVWVSNTGSGGTSGGFLANLGNALVNKLKSFIPSTNPLGAFGGTSTNTWKYRPEYPSSGQEGIYYKFLADSSGFLSVNTRVYPTFYNGSYSSNGTNIKKVAKFHKYYPDYATTTGMNATDQGNLYAKPADIASDSVGFSGNNLNSVYQKMLDAIESPKNTAPQLKGSSERYSEIKDYRGVSYPTYKNIPNGGEASKKFAENISQKGATTLDRRGFAKVSSYSDISNGNIGSDAYDSYNTLDPLNSADGLNQKRGDIPNNITGYADNQSKDVIFFYFFDLINEIYIPFRATISGITDQNSADWEDVSYLGRADKLWIYKGFTRETGINFRVYANSAKEMLPMWNRISYLVGLTRPSKYTGKAVVTNANQNVSTTGAESSFIYPPMVTLRLGDLFYDQPCLIGSVTVTVPDESTWESLRAQEYEYMANPNNPLKMTGVKSRQLPMIADVSVQIKLLEKKQPITKDLHYGNSEYDSNGNETKRWVL